MRALRSLVVASAVGALALAAAGCDAIPGAGKLAAKPAAKTAQPAPELAPRLVMFVGVDISGSFMNGRYFDDSLDFLAHYIYGHLNGLGEMEKPHALFVGSIGGRDKDEAKTLYPIETFQNRDVAQIKAELVNMFPKGRVNTYTDFNAFFAQVADMIGQKKLLLKPISIVLLTDGDPDMGDTSDSREMAKFKSLQVEPLETLSRNITVRVLYTDAVTAKNWRDEVPRKRVKVWTQDAVVMAEWKDPALMLPDQPESEQTRVLLVVRGDVDFVPRLKPVGLRRAALAPGGDAHRPRPERRVEPGARSSARGCNPRRVALHSPHARIRPPALAARPLAHPAGRRPRRLTSRARRTGRYAARAARAGARRAGGPRAHRLGGLLVRGG